MSPYKGRGVEFDESRPYQPGDDLRTIDWRVTARTGKPHTKVFREERNRPVFVWLDLRRPMLFATRGAFKAVRAAEVAALVAWSAVANGDRLGGLVFSETEHHEQRPALGARAALRLFQTVCTQSFWQPPATAETLETDAERALQRLTRVARPGSLIFLVSDFRRLGPDYERYLQRARRALRPVARALLRCRRGRTSAAGPLSNPERRPVVQHRDGERSDAPALPRAIRGAARRARRAVPKAGDPCRRLPYRRGPA